MNTLYTSLFFLALPVIVLRLIWRGLKAPDYFKRWPERFGKVATLPNDKPVIWLHAVSVGETEACKPLIKALQTQYPQHTLLITTMTPTGSARVKQSFKDSVAHCYLPYDLPFAMNAFLDATHPEFGIIMETEIWPNMVQSCHKRDIPLVLVNARMSERSHKGYLRFGNFTQSILNKFTFIAVQNATDAKRIQSLGVKKERVFTVGNLKYEITLPPSLNQQAEAMRNMWDRKRPVWIAASTHEGEDELILNASRQVRGHFPDLLLIIVPRHPERFDRVTALCQKSGFVTLRRSENKPCSSNVQVLMIDTMGELMLFYGCADVAFVGGSLVPHGGHNMLEPAALGKPSITGPHYFNFTVIAKQFLEHKALLEVEDTEALAKAVIELLQSPTKRDEMSTAGLELIRHSQGASDRILNLLKRHVTN